MNRYIYATSAGVYSTDGTTAGTTLLLAAAPAFVPQPGTPMVTLPNGKVMFFGLVNHNLDPGDALTSGISIWETDGTVAGTVYIGGGLAPDGLADPGDTISNVVAIGSEVSFAFNIPGQGSYLFATDGTSSGAVEQPGLLPQTGLANGALIGSGSATRYIYATSAGVYSTDGTTAGTTLLLAASPAFVPQPGAQVVTLPDGKALFIGLVNHSLDPGDAVASGIRIWETDGTVAGTVYIGGGLAPDSVINPADSISNVVAIDSQVSFAYNIPGGGSYLFATDATSSGAVEQPGVLPQTGLANGVLIGSGSAARYIFASSAGVYSTDGTTAGTTLLEAAGPDFVPQLGAQLVPLPNGEVMFFGLVNRSLDPSGAVTHGISIWETDGTAAGTVLASGALAPDGIANPGDAIRNVVAIGSEVSFAYDIPGGASYVFATDGTYSGTHAEPGVLPQTGLANGAEAVCFRRGALIKTATGEVAIEDLRAGDPVETVFGGVRTIKWIGRQSFDGRFLGQAQAPVCFHKDAIADNVPSRDLYVSPAHGVVIDGRLIPAWLLVNGANVTQTASDERIDYFHLDLGVHDCVIANGAPSESYAEQNNRAMFHNRSEFDAAFPDHVAAFQPSCLPQLHQYSDELDAIRARLLSRAPQAWLTDDPDLHVLADGRRIDATRIDRWNWSFAVPAGVRKLRLASRASRPSAFGRSPDVRDLGFCIEAVSSRQATQTLALRAQHAAFKIGYHEPEGEGDASWRWTRGLCELPESLLGPGEGRPGEAALITVRGHALDRYVVAPPPPLAMAVG